MLAVLNAPCKPQRNTCGATTTANMTCTRFSSRFGDTVRSNTSLVMTAHCHWSPWMLLKGACATNIYEGHLYKALFGPRQGCRGHGCNMPSGHLHKRISSSVTASPAAALFLCAVGVATRTHPQICTLTNWAVPSQDSGMTSSGAPSQGLLCFALRIRSSVWSTSVCI